MNKTWLIIKREYLSRVRKKSFIIMTLLGPVLMAGMLTLALWLSIQESDIQKVLVVDENYPLFSKMEGTSSIKFESSNITLGQAKSIFHESDYTSILHLPKGIINAKSHSAAGNLFFKKQPSIRQQRIIENKVQEIVELAKLDLYDIDKKDYMDLKVRVIVSNIKFESPGNEEEKGELGVIVGFAFAVLIYLFVFMYGIQVMRGVIEEKTSRIVEVIISSVKPFQLMIGKIVGIGLVSLTQFILWIILTFSIAAAGQYYIFSTQLDPSHLSDLTNVTPEVRKEMEQESSSLALKLINEDSIWNDINSINFPLMIGLFLFYFVGGYLLYSSLFAAIGSAVDSETDTQQFMLPVTLPLLLSYFVGLLVVQNPEGPAAVWFSIIPFTSPIVMMVRAAVGGFNPETIWQLYLSMALLVAGFLFTIWMAARIYRTGILMYGKKANYKELWKWMRHQS